MKKTLVALAALSAMCATASAADVTVYGKVDVGLAFTSIDNGKDSRVNQLSEQSGQTAGSRWGIRGVEDLGDGYKVGFKLEGGFNVDSGTMAQGNRLFGRQASLFIEGGFGNLKFGRMGELSSGFPDTGLFGGNMSAFAVGFGEVPGHRFIFSGDFSPLDNAITYTTPTFAGWNMMVQYSLGSNNRGNTFTAEEGKSSSDRYMALAMHYADSETEFNAVLDSWNYATYNTKTGGSIEADDSLAFTVGIRHRFDAVTLYADAQVFKDARSFLQESNHFYKTSTTKFLTNTDVGKDGWGATVSVDYPALGGILKGQVGYMDAERSDDSSVSLKRTIASVGYWYDFSKRTALYANVGYIYDKGEGKTFKDLDNASCIAAGLGLVHNF